MSVTTSATAAAGDTATHPCSGFDSTLKAMLCVAAASIVVHVLTGGQYGFHRDELATLDDAWHLAWGFVAYPPLTPFLGRVSLTLFGTSLAGFRFFAGVASAVALVLTGLMAREMGGRRGAQLLTILAVLAPCIGAGVLMQYVAFDYLWWVLTAYFVVRLLRSEDPRWWVAVGAGITDGHGDEVHHGLPGGGHRRGRAVHRRTAISEK